MQLLHGTIIDTLVHSSEYRYMTMERGEKSFEQIEISEWELSSAGTSYEARMRSERSATNDEQENVSSQSGPLKSRISILSTE